MHEIGAEAVRGSCSKITWHTMQDYHYEQEEGSSSSP